MVAGKIAKGLEALKVFTDLIPEPVVKALVNLAVERSIAICTSVERVGDNSNALRDLSEQQAGLAADIVSELKGLTDVQIKSGRWNDKLSDLSQVLNEVHTFVARNTADDEDYGRVVKAKKTFAKLWHSSEKQAEIKTLKDKLVNIRSRLEMKIAITTSIDAQCVRDIVLDMKSSVATSGDMQNMVQDLKRIIVTSAEAQRITEIISGFSNFYEKTLVDRLKPVLAGRYGAHGSPKDCLPNTRVRLRQELRQLLTADNERCVVWLSGLAGTGKSTVARSICGELQDTHDVVSFFIKRDDAERSNQLRILHTLVYQLAQCLPPVLTAVVGAKDEAFAEHLHKQVLDLVITPLSTAHPGTRAVVIVLDAADERDPALAQECDLITCFLDAIATAAPPVRVLVTGRGHPSDFLRPTYEAVHDTQRVQQSFLKVISMHDESYDPQSDIRAYLVVEFKRVAMKRSLSDWLPSPDQINDLVRMSARLFIFAATIIRWVDCSAPVFALSQLLKESSALMERTGPGTIFALYEYVIGHALDEDTPQQLLRTALGKNADDRVGADALCREATLSILSTLRCLREDRRVIAVRQWRSPTEECEPLEDWVTHNGLAQLTHHALAQLWAGHLISEPELYQGVVAMVEDLISRLSGVLFVWERHSSMTLLHASFGDFLEISASRYHISVETTHYALAAKCVSIMLSTKDDYSSICRTELAYPLTTHRLDRIPWISSSDLAARYSFAQWIHHASSSLPSLLPPLLKQIRLAERGFWFAGVFLYPRYINIYSLQRAFKAMRDHPEGVEAAYTLATTVLMCLDESDDFKSLSDVLNILDRCASVRLERDREARDFALRVGGTVRDLQRRLPRFDAFSPNDLSRILEKLIEILSPTPRRRPWMTNYQVSLDYKEPPPCRIHSGMLAEWAEKFRYALRVKRQKMIQTHDAEFIAALDKRTAGLAVGPANEGGGSDDGHISPSEDSLSEDDNPSEGVQSTPSAGLLREANAPRRPERQSLQFEEVLPREARVDSSPSEGQPPMVDEPPPSEGQSSQAVTPLPYEERTTVTTSTTSTVGFFAVLVLLYLLLSSLFA